MNFDFYKPYLHGTNISLEEISRLIDDIYKFNNSLNTLANFDVVLNIRRESFNKLFHRSSAMISNGWNPFNITRIDRYLSEITISPDTLIKCYITQKIRNKQILSSEIVYNGISDGILNWFRSQLVFTYGLIKQVYDEMEESGNKAEDTYALSEIKLYLHEPVLDIVFNNVKYTRFDRCIFDEKNDTNVCLVKDNSELLTANVVMQYFTFFGLSNFISDTNDMFGSEYTLDETDFIANIISVNSWIVFSDYYAFNEKLITEHWIDEADEGGYIFVYDKLYRPFAGFRVFNNYKGKPMDELYDYGKEMMRLKEWAERISKVTRFNEWIMFACVSVLFEDDVLLQCYIKN